MKTTFKFLSTLLLIVSINALLTSCDDEPDPAEREHDSSLFGEWIEYGGKYKHIADYYFFYSDGTCLHGTYDRDIDWVDEDDEYEWYTVDNKRPGEASPFKFKFGSQQHHAFPLTSLPDASHINNNKLIYNIKYYFPYNIYNQT